MTRDSDSDHTLDWDTRLVNERAALVTRSLRQDGEVEESGGEAGEAGDSEALPDCSRDLSLFGVLRSSLQVITNFINWSRGQPRYNISINRIVHNMDITITSSIRIV